MSTDRAKLVLATTNKGKIRELSALLRDLPIELVGLAAFPEIGEIAENGLTFAENALIKARAVCKFTGLIALADDSGLIVDALNGEPGVHSARYGEEIEAMAGEGRDAKNIRKLLMKMESVPENMRSCRFITAMAIVSSDGREAITEGIWEGRVLKDPLGVNGFGYDPVFYDPESGKSAAQMSPAEKNSRSHRAKALNEMLNLLPEFLRIKS